MASNRIVPFMGFMTVAILLENSRSLKDRRQVTRSLLERIRNRWNVSAMDLGPANSYRKIFLGFGCVGTSSEMVLSRMNSIGQYIEKAEGASQFEILCHRQEVSSYGELSY